MKANVKVTPVLSRMVLVRLWLYSLLLLTLYGMACLVLAEAFTGGIGVPGLWVPFAFAYGLHLLLALAVFRKEVRIEPTVSLHMFDLIALVAVWWVGPLAWAKERQKR